MSIKQLSKYIAEQIIIDEISRIDMPQIKGDNIPEALSIFKKYGVPYTLKVIDPNELLPIQSDYIPDKVNNIIKSINNNEKMNPIFISSDNYIVDGHHRWLAFKDLGKLEMKVIQVKYPKNAALKLFDKLDNNLNENQRVCPGCKKILTYSSKRKKVIAENLNRICKSCSKIGKNNPIFGKKGIDNPSYKQKRQSISGKNNPFYKNNIKEKIKETNYSNGKWVKPEDKSEFINYYEKVKSITQENYTKYFYDIPNSNKRSREYHLDHKYSIHSGFKNNIPPEVVGHYKNLEILPHSINESKGNKNSITLEQLFLDIKNSKNPLDKIKKTIVVYPGRFQPFHSGHYYSYNDLVSKFGKNNVYIATSDKVESGKSPFSFNDKKEIITKLFKIPSSRVVKVKNPYRPEEILKSFDPKTTAVIVAVGEKDVSRLGGKYYIPYKGKVQQGYLDKGYVYLVPQLQLKINGKTISGTEVRNNFSKELFKGLYPKYDEQLFNLMKNKLNESLITEGGAYVKCEICGELHKDLSRHLIKHNLNSKEYKEKYPGSKLVSEEKRIKNKLGGKISGPYNRGNKRPDLSKRNKDPEFIKKMSVGVKESYNKNPELRQLRAEQFKNKEIRKKIKETNYSNGNWKRPEMRSDFINYYEKVRAITTENYNKYFYEIKDAKKRSRDFHLDHKYSIHSGFVNNIPPEVVGHYKNLEILPHSINESKFNKNSITLEQLILDIQNSKSPLNNKILLLCGGAFGHLKHPFEDMDLTFGDMKNMIKLALEGKLELTQEKTDGQNLLFSWIDGKLRAARNASHTKNFGKNALDISGVSNMFSGRGEIHTAFVEALNDLQSAISKLSEKQRQKIFANGKKFMSVEVIYPQTTNVVPYNYAMLVFHGTLEYDEQGNKIGADKSEATLLANMIKQINADVQNTFKIRAPNNLKLPKVQNFASQKSYFLGKLNKLQQEFGLKDSDNIIMYHQKWWEDFVNSKYTLPNNIVSDLVKRWAYNDKSIKIVDIKNKISKLDKPEILKWVDQFDKTEYTNKAKENLRKFESIFLELGAKILKNINVFLAANPDQALNQLRSSLDKSIKDIENSNDISAINKLKTQLERLESLGGFDAIVPSEGITFMFNGNLYKLTGAFAPINQILGILRY